MRDFLRDLATASIRLRVATAFVVALAVTSLVIVPLGYRAFDARGDDGPVLEAATDGVALIDGGTEVDLEGLDLTGEAVIAFTVPGVEAVAYRVVDDDGIEVLSGVDDNGPDFNLATTDDGEPAAIDTTALADGPYTLFATLTVGGGEDHRMAEFDIRNER
ncbi:MAG: hypothetical protein OEU32_13700 [Acidimicrobiia bacterium]|nr:hypothetical protein [Acidimicrobiia bacterium]